MTEDLSTAATRPSAARSGRRSYREPGSGRKSARSGRKSARSGRKSGRLSEELQAEGDLEGPRIHSITRNVEGALD